MGARASEVVIFSRVGILGQTLVVENSAFFGVKPIITQDSGQAVVNGR